MITKIDDDYIYQTIMTHSDASAEQLSIKIDRFEIPIIGDSIIVIYKEWYGLLVADVIKVTYDRSI